MPSKKKWRIPQFSVANLLVLTAAVAVGFAVSQSPPPDESAGGLFLTWLTPARRVCGGIPWLACSCSLESLLLLVTNWHAGKSKAR